LDKFRAWFDEYVTRCYGEDKSVNANLKLKEQHSRRTCEEMLYLAEELDLDENQKRVAEVTALFHDVGRFEQFVKYHTYNDLRSVNHCLLGVDVLRRAKVLDSVNEPEKEIIEKAIEYHGLKELPKDLDGETLLFSKLLRDADKLDILYVEVEFHRQYRANPQGFMLELEFPDRPEFSAEVVEDVLGGRRVDYSKLRTLNDMKLLQLGWVYDVNFTATLRRMRRRKLLEMLLDFLPPTADIEKLRKSILGFVDFRIEARAKGRT